MKRTWFMQYLLNTSYPNVAIIAVQKGTLDGAWEDAIVKLLKQEMTGTFKKDAEELLKLANGDYFDAAILVRNSTLTGDKMKVLSLLPFVKTIHGDIGIAENGTFAASMWRISDDAFKKVHATKFSWITPDGLPHVDNKSAFLRPTEDEVLQKISPILKAKAVTMGLLSAEAVETATTK